MNNRTTELPNYRTLVDPVTVEVIGNALLAVADEMGASLIRSAYSTNIKERRDCSTALFDAAGEVVAQAEHMPMHLGALLGIVAETERRFGPTLKPGDVIVSNDPYTGGSTHLPDITLCQPVFVDGALAGYVTNTAHHADVYRTAPRTIYEEGPRIPPIRLYDGGQLREDVLELILLNYQIPEQRLGDLRAQLAANATGERRFQDLFERYGRATLEAAMIELLAYGERKIRAAIRAIPDGTYTFLDYLDDDAVGDTPVPIRVAITVAGDRMRLDFTGTGPQSRGDINVVYLALLATVYYSIKALLDPSVPPNGGFFRSLEVVAPEGCLLNARPPGACDWRTQPCQRVADAIFGALAPVIPERVIAATNGANTAIFFSGPNPATNRPFAYLETLAGGSGARATKDGLDAIQVHITNSSNLPVEALEMEYPLLVETYALVPDSGGAGRWRGGLGLRRDIRALGEGVIFHGHLERSRLAPWGLFGGGEGGRARLAVNPGSTQERPLPPKVYGVSLAPGDIVSIITPGSGGYGPPAERDRQLLQEDLLEGKVTPAGARAYGYVDLGG